MSIKLTGRSIIGFTKGSASAKTFTAFNPETGDEVEPRFYSATESDVDRAIELAYKARLEYGKVSGKDKAAFLRKIAENIEALGDSLIKRATLETGLPNARFQGERSRTCSQLRLFADLVEEGSWVGGRIDMADSDRAPLPKPDVRSMLRPVGPVAIFCAGNFPLAFSVAGGDSASALAAGCPIVVNSHSAHPGTAQLVGSAIEGAVKSCGLPEGVFSLLFSSDYEVGQNLVRHTKIKAVGFTGSQLGGRALMDIAASRNKPIPVYAEMSSVNPIFILPSALAENSSALAIGLHGSFTLGAGQFCTKPGIVILPDYDYLQAFTETLYDLVRETPASALLTSGIQQNYNKGFENREGTAAAVSGNARPEGFFVNVSVFQTDAQNFLRDSELGEEIFGPTTLLVKTEKRDEMLDIARQMEGQLTATIHGTNEDLEEFADLISILETKVGRLIFNGFPTGVEVCHAMVHGGVYPATSDSRSTSVGTRAIERFTRLVCYQDFPQEVLPDELKDKNPLAIWRMVDGETTRE